MRKPLGFLAIAMAFLISSFPAKAGDLSKTEQALVNKGAFMEMYKPDEHSRHFIAHISATDPRQDATQKAAKNSPAVVCFVFGIEDAQPARAEGKSMAECKYSPQQAHEFLFAQGWGKYHDRFFTRCHVQEGEQAYDQAVKAQQKPVDQSSSS